MHAIDLEHIKFKKYDFEANLYVYAISIVYFLSKKKKKLILDRIKF